MQFTNKVVLVTGGSSGLGFAIAEAFASEGATLVITGRRQPQLADAVSRLGKHASGVCTDISNPADLAELFDDIRVVHGRIDVLIANSGIGAIEPLGAITEAGFDRVFTTNVKGTTFTLQPTIETLVTCIQRTLSFLGRNIGLYGR